MIMEIDWIEAGRMVRLRRKEQRLSQAAMAVGMGLSSRALGELERGEVTRPSARLVEVVRELLGTLPEPGGRRFTPRQIDIRRAQEIIAALGHDPTLWACVRHVLLALQRRAPRRLCETAPQATAIRRAQEELAVLGQRADPMLWAAVMEVLTALQRSREERQRKNPPVRGRSKGESA